VSNDTGDPGQQVRVFPKWMVHYEYAMLGVAIVGPFATLPQIYKLFFSHPEHASGQSLTTWSLYAALSALWFVYGIVEKKSAIWLGNGLSLILNSVMAVGILIHAGLTF
jgi:MtN3 and saliva related transmembrane protein